MQATMHKPEKVPVRELKTGDICCDSSPTDPKTSRLIVVGKTDKSALMVNDYGQFTRRAFMRRSGEPKMYRIGHYELNPYTSKVLRDYMSSGDLWRARLNHGRIPDLPRFGAFFGYGPSEEPEHFWMLNSRDTVTDTVDLGCGERATIAHRSVWVGYNRQSNRTIAWGAYIHDPANPDIVFGCLGYRFLTKKAALAATEIYEETRKTETNLDIAVRLASVAANRMLRLVDDE